MVSKFARSLEDTFAAVFISWLASSDILPEILSAFVNENRDIIATDMAILIIIAMLDFEKDAVTGKYSERDYPKDII